MFDKNEMQYFPNDDEPKILAYCPHCNEPIYEGDEVYEFDGQWFCTENCILEYLEVKRVTAEE